MARKINQYTFVEKKRTKRRFKKDGVKHRKSLGPKSHLRIFKK